MTKAPALDSGERRSRAGTVLKALGAGLVLLLVAGLVGGFVLFRCAESDLDARLAGLQQEVDAARTWAAAPRSVLVGEPESGNAVDSYRALEWAWGREGEPPAGVLAEAWEDREAVGGALCPDVLIDELTEHLAGGELPGDAALAMVRDRRPLTRYVRNALRQDRCDWELRFDGSFNEGPDGICLRQVAVVMAYDALLTGDDNRSLTRGLELLAFARDLQRYPSLVFGLVAARIERLGIRSLERTVATRALTTEQLQRVHDLLSHLPDCGSARGLDGDRLELFTVLLGSTGRYLDPNAAERAGLGKDSGWLAEVFLWRELSGLEHFEARKREICALPFHERAVASEAFEAEVLDSSYTLAGIAGGNPSWVEDEFDAVRALRGALQTVVAAHLVRLEQGSFPSTLSPLPSDPFHPALRPLSYVVEGEAIRVSCGEGSFDRSTLLGVGSQIPTSDPR